MAGKYVLEATGIAKSFSGVTVLNGAELCIEPGELHALMGENGAGKSTLMKIIMGIYTKDAGKVVLDGKEVEFKSARDALDAGISMIHQELSPIPEMTVAENVFTYDRKINEKIIVWVNGEANADYNADMRFEPMLRILDVYKRQLLH